MTLTFNRLVDYDYSPHQHVYEVLKGNIVLGILENWEGQREWKAFLSSTFSCKFLSKHYTKESAVEAILQANAEL